MGEFSASISARTNLGSLSHWDARTSSLCSCLILGIVQDLAEGAIYHTEVCTEVCAGAIYPNKVVSEPGYDKQWQKTRTDIGAEGTTEGTKQNRNKSKSWKIGEIKYRQNITCWNCNQKGHFQNQCLKLVASRDKEVNMARDSDDALVCCVENTVEDRIMDSGASFHATYCKEELERFKLRSGKVRLADDKTLDIAGVGDVVLKTSFGTSWTLKDVRYIPGLKRRLISVGQLDEEGYHVGFGDQQWKVTKGSLVVARGNKCECLYMVEVHPEEIGAITNSSGSAAVGDKETAKAGASSCRRIVMLKMVPETPLHFGVAKRLSQTFRAESMRHRAEAPKMLWANSVSTTYLIYRIPYVPIGLRILEEEWRGKDTSLAHLKAAAQMKCDTAFGIRRVTRLSVAEILHLWTRFMEPDTSEGSKNSGSFEDSGRSDEEFSKDGASSNEGGSETPHVRRSTRESRAPVRLPAGKKASQRLWMFKVKEEQDGSKRYKARLVEPSYVGALNDTSTQHKSEGFQLAGQKENLECRLKEIMYGLIQAPRLRYLKFDSFMQKDKMKDRCSEKQVLGYVLTVGVTTVEWESRLQKSITIYTKSSIHLVKNLKVCSWAKLVRILISEGSLSLLKILGTKSLAAMFTRLVMKEKLKFCAASTGLRVN
ncbi:retrovirus-related pol polyprotein from transposon TNT 1-94 [Tanacetum coccineum]